MLQDAATSGSLTADEFVSALHGLTDEEWIRVDEAARWFGRFRANGDELLSEAIGRTMDGRRHCPRGVHPVAFLIQTIRSISGEVLGYSEDHVGLDVATVTDVRGKVVPFQPKDDGPDPVTKLTQSEWVAKFRSAILGLFNDDPVARDLADGMMEGLEGEELRMLLDLDPIAFASKRRLVRRRIDKAFPNGWKS